jgi:redox-sensitive bicupin YhaK (pirin superfamily)
VIRGDVSLNGHDLHEGDGAAISEEEVVKLTARTETEVLLFDLA